MMSQIRKKINKTNENQEINLPNLHVQINYNQGVIQSVFLVPTQAKGIEWTFSSSFPDRKLEVLVNDWLESYCSYCQKKVSSILPLISLPFAWDALTPFIQEVLQVIKKIPVGSVYTYGQIAAMINRPQAARAVGRACGLNPFPLFIPCHRVLDAKKELRGYSAGGIVVKQSLLIFEDAH